MPQRNTRLILTCLLTLITVASGARISSAQTGQRISSKHIPDDAIVAAVASPAQMLSSPEWELMPVEVFRAAGLEHVGIDPMHVDHLKIVVGMPGPAGPQVGAVFHLSQPYQIANLKPALLQNFELKEVQGRQVYESRRPPMMRLHQLEPQTIFVSSGGYSDRMINAPENGSGQVAELASKISQRDGITLIAGMEQIRPLITGMLRQQAQKMPEQIREITDFAEWTDALLVNVDYAPLNGAIAVSAIGRDEASATKLEQALNGAIDFARDMATAEMTKNVRGTGPINDAMHQYIDRLGTHFSGMVRPTRNDNVVRVNLEGNIGTTGILVGLLLPAVQSARQAARRMSSNNNLKQVSLAMHNHHSAYKKLPDRVSRDAEGKPLLSWRVAILPFIEQQQLYSEFHLDEPWDSPHNIQLLDRMPKIYESPNNPTQPGHTVVQVPTGPGLMFEETGERKFRDILDGLSNTIMILESNPDVAIPWTKPVDLKIDMQQPLKNVGNAQHNGFYVSMGDGAVIFLSDSISPDLFKALLTRAGKEVIDGQFR